MKRPSILLLASTMLVGLLAAVLTIMPSLAFAPGGGSYIGQFTHIRTVASTVPVTGDINPYGVAVVPTTTGNLTKGNILTVNGNDGRIVETTPGGTQIAHKFLDKTGTPPGAGCLFGLAIVPGAEGVYFVDDCTNTLNILNQVAFHVECGKHTPFCTLAELLY